MILVTGATGKLDERSCDNSLTWGYQFAPWCAIERKLPREAQGAEIAVADLSRAETLTPALVGIDKKAFPTSTRPIWSRDLRL
jgi:uncharacterized protein YbjT (DUF2867 family)